MSRETKYISVGVGFAANTRTGIEVSEAFMLMVPQELYEDAEELNHVMKEQAVIIARIHGFNEKTVRLVGWSKAEEANHA